MRGAAIEAATRAEKLIVSLASGEPGVAGDRGGSGRFNTVIASSMLNVAEFKGLLAGTAGALAQTPVILVMHENQIAYPAPHDGERDIHFALTNLTSCLAAERVVWNSGYNRDSFLEGIKQILKKMPDERPRNVTARILEKSVVLSPGIEADVFEAAGDVGDKVRVAKARSWSASDVRRTAGLRAGARGGRQARIGPARILWNHRWEHDKAPERFFRALQELSSRGVAFEITVIGESFGDAPESFARARSALDKHIVTWGFQQDRQSYVDAVADCDIAVSTADHEFFGISMLEAAAAGCRPLVPRRLAYPEIFPEEFLYDSEDELVSKLEGLIARIEVVRAESDSYSGLAAAYSWSNLAASWSELITSSGRS